MLTKEWLDIQTKRLEKINLLISELTKEQIKILEDTRKEILELITENNSFFMNKWEPQYDENEITITTNGTNHDIERRKTDIYNLENEDFRRRQQEWIPTIYNLLNDNERLKKT